MIKNENEENKEYKENKGNKEIKKTKMKSHPKIATSFVSLSWWGMPKNEKQKWKINNQDLTRI